MQIRVDDYLAGPAYVPGGSATFEIQGSKISAIGSAQLIQMSGGLAAIPALINAHDHARPLSATSLGGAGRPLETWLPRLAIMPPADPHLAALCALGRSARGGCAGTMVHLTRPMGKTALPEEAVAIARAAGDIGIPIAFAVSLRDMNPLVYGDHSIFLDNLAPVLKQQVEGIWLRKPADWRSQLALVEDVAAAIATASPAMPVDVQLGPNGLQWCSRAMLEGVAEASALSGRRVHMHFLESSVQRKWMDEAYPEGAVRFLKEIGLLSSRLTLAHCVWARPDELESIAESGARIAVNPSSNLALFSGIAPAKKMFDMGIPVALGLDGCTLDEDDDALRELRLLRLLNSGTSYGSGLRGSEPFTIACSNGRASIGLDGTGTLEAGQPANMIILDMKQLNEDGIIDVDLRDLVFSRANTGHIHSVIVGGKMIVENGRVLGADVVSAANELREFYRSAIGDQAPILDAWTGIEPSLIEFNRNLAGCE